MRNALLTALVCLGATPGIAATSTMAPAAAPQLSSENAAPQHKKLGLEIELDGGRRYADTHHKNDTKTSYQLNDATFAARYDILGSGLAVGPAITYGQVASGDWKGDLMELGLEARYAHPVTPWLTPFAKARYIGYSRGTLRNDEGGQKTDRNLRTYGTQLALGAAYDVTSLVQLTAEAGYGVQMIRTTGGKATLAAPTVGAGAAAASPVTADLPGSGQDDFNNKSFMVGVNVRI